MSLFFFFKFPLQVCGIKSELDIPFWKKIKASSHVFAAVNKVKKKTTQKICGPAFGATFTQP